MTMTSRRNYNVRYEEFPDAFHDLMMLSILPETKRALRSQAEFLCESVKSPGRLENLA